jgi:hypothetical protein
MRTKVPISQTLPEDKAQRSRRAEEYDIEDPSISEDED